MFKRIEKRRRREEEEEELGLSEDAKQLLGLQDTDSDETNSSDDEESEKQSDGEADGDEGAPDYISSNEGDEPDSDPRPSISVAQALQNPIYAVSLDSRIHSCVVCPKRLLKNSTMLSVHLESHGHKRRYKRFTIQAASAEPDSDIWNLISPTQGMPAPTAELSKRAQRRKARREFVVAKREAGKEKKAKRLARIHAKEKEREEKKVAKASAGPSPSRLVSLQHPKLKDRDMDEPPKKKGRFLLETKAAGEGEESPDFIPLDPGTKPQKYKERKSKYGGRGNRKSDVNVPDKPKHEGYHKRYGKKLKMK